MSIVFFRYRIGPVDVYLRFHAVYPACMLKDDVRAARLAAGLSVSEVARRAGIPRKQVQKIENGGNVTMDTLRQIAVALPNLTRVMLGGMEIVLANADLEEARRAALDLFDVAKRLLSALGAAPASPVARPPSERETAERLERMIPELKRGRRKASA